MRKAKRELTQKDFDYVKKYYGKKTRRQIADDLGLSISSVFKLASEAGVTKKRVTTEEAEYIHQYLKKHYPNGDTKEIAKHLGITVRNLYLHTNRLGLKKDKEWWKEERKRLRKHAKTHPNIRKNQFKKGHTPWTAGRKLTPHPNSIKTQFRKGQGTGKDNPKWVPVGSERITKDGYLQIKVNDDIPFYKRWKSYHNILWEETNGPIPKGHSVVFKPGTRSSVKEEIKLESLELISNAELMRRNTIHRYPPELVQIMQTLGRLDKQIQKKEGSNE